MTTSCPMKLSKAVFVVINIISFVLVGTFFDSWFLPDSLSLFLSFNKCSAVGISICPSILTVALSLAVDVFSNENIAVRKDIRSLAVSQRVPPLAFVAVSILPLVDSVSLSHILDPLADVTVSLHILPNSVAVLHSIEPLSIVGILICPTIYAFATYLTVLVITNVGISITKYFVASTMPFVVLPGSLKMPSVVIYTYS